MAAGQDACQFPFRKTLVISNNVAHMEQDKASMRHFRMPPPRTFESGAEAFGYLAANSCDLILCDTVMDDMDARSFLRMLKKNPELRGVPVIMVTTANDRDSVLDAIAAGCSGYILRPYSPDTFERHVTLANQLTRYSEIEVKQLGDAKKMVEEGNYDEAIEEFEAIIAMQEEARKYYDLGCRYLVAKKYANSIVAFNKALRINDLYAEAYQGLAEAYLAKGEMEEYKRYLKLAAEKYAEFDRLEEAKSMFIEILKHDDQAPNPFNTLGVRLRKNSDFEGAIRAYRQALELTPKDEHIYFNMAKAYYFMGDNEQALENLGMALTYNSGFDEAHSLYRQLKGRAWSGTSAARGGFRSGAESETLMDI